LYLVHGRCLCPGAPVFSDEGKKGVPAQMWLESLTRFQNLYQLTDAQLLKVARFSCKGEYAALWAGLLPADFTLHDFKELFKAEFACDVTRCVKAGRPWA
jgi:hypothetical protein